MSNSSPPFIALAVDGRISPARIDDFVDRWHDEDGRGHLHDYLGMTRSEYALWLVAPDMLDVIVKARAEGISLLGLVSNVLAYRDASGADLAQLERWLAAQTTRD